MNKFQFAIGERTVETSVERSGNGWKVQADGRVFEILSTPHDSYLVTVDGRKSSVAAVKHKGVVYVDLGRYQLELTESSDAAASGAAAGSHGAKDKIFAPMPGRIVKILVNVGDAVTERQQLVIVEAMKMENPVLAPAAGTVKSVHFKAGDQVDTESAIVELDIALG